MRKHLFTLAALLVISFATAPANAQEPTAGNPKTKQMNDQQYAAIKKDIGDKDFLLAVVYDGQRKIEYWVKKDGIYEDPPMGVDAKDVLYTWFEPGKTCTLIGDNAPSCTENGVIASREMSETTFTEFKLKGSYPVIAVYIEDAPVEHLVWKLGDIATNIAPPNTVLEWDDPDNGITIMRSCKRICYANGRPYCCAR